MESDLALVIDCLKHHDVQNYSAQRDSLLTIAALCTESDAAKNHFRESGGLGYVLSMLTSKDDDEVKVTILYTLGCATERNVYSQRRLCGSVLLKYLQCQLSSQKSSVKLKRSATFLICCLVTNNSTGQNDVRNTGCLDCLLSTLSNLLKSKGSPQDLWKDIIKTLGYCVNNPQNPANQTRLGILGGLDVIISALQDLVQSFIKVPDKQKMTVITGLVTTLGVAATDHKSNCEILTELRLIPLLVQLLSSEVLTNEVKLKIILTMSSVTQSSELSQKQLVRSDGLALLVQILLQNQDDNEMRKTISSVLESCLRWVTALGAEDMLYSNTPALDSTVNQSKADVFVKPTAFDHPLKQFQEILGASKNSLLRVNPKTQQPYQRCVIEGLNSDELNTWNNSLQSEKLSCLDQNIQDTNPLTRLLHLVSNQTDERIKRVEAEVSSLPLNDIEPTDDTSDVNTVSTGYGDIHQKLESFEDKFDKVLDYVYSRKQADVTKKDVSTIDVTKKDVSTIDVTKKDVSTIDVTKKDVSTIDVTKKDVSTIDVTKKDVSASEDVNRNDEEEANRGTSTNNNVAESYTDKGDIITREINETSGRQESCEEKRPITCGESSQIRNDLVNKQVMRDNEDRQAVRMRDEDTNSVLVKAADGSVINQTEPVNEKGDVYCKHCLKKCVTGSKTEGIKCNETQKSCSDIVDDSCLAGWRQEDKEEDTSRNGIDKNIEYSVIHSTNELSNTELSTKDEMVHRRVKSRKSTLVPKPNERGGDGLESEELSSRCELLTLECPACCTRTHLHSKSFVKTLMSSQHVCNHHRNLVSKIKDQYHRKLHNLGSKKNISSQGNCDVYSFSEDEKLQQAFTVDKCEIPLLPKKLLQRKIKDTTRRQRQDFSEGEIRNLMKGVKRHGKHWNAILWTYHFKKGRTGIDLKDKYRRLVRNHLH
ncbi:uncharacterized protein [Apostichopus japonicus]|uniref:uncharacterized protein isoform X2 n=1 Tax=Stichopus japonicus TaxID=307972 RepID=UPI003AB4F5C4